MLVVHRRGGEELELEVDVDRATATVADLLAALGEPGPDLIIDGVVVHAELSLVETPLVRGSVVWAPPRRRGVGAERADGRQPGAAPRPGPGRATAATTLVSVAGMGAGRRLPLRPGTWLVGRHPGADVVVDSPTVSARHAGLRVAADGAVEVRDLGSHNGTWRGGRPVAEDWTPVADGELLRLGAVVVRFERRPPADRASALHPVRHADGQGRVTLDRPPRPPATAGAGPIRVPDPPRLIPRHLGLALLPSLLPAAGGLATVAVTGNWLFALLPLLSPVIALAAWAQGRRRAGRASRREQTRFQRDLTALGEALADVTAQEVTRRRAAHPDLGEVVRRAESSSVRLWERRPADDDWLTLGVGVGPVPWEAPVSPRPDPLPEAVAEVLAAAAHLPEAPVVAHLAAGGVLGVVGPRALSRAVARALVLQAVVHHGPADLSLVVAASPEAATAWTWCRWLPHAEPVGPPAPGGPGRPAGPAPGGSGDGFERGVPLRVGSASSASLLRRLLAEGGRPPGGASDGRHSSPSPGPPTRLVVVDDEALLRGPRAPARAVLRGEAGPVAGIVVAAAADRLPASCTAVLELGGIDGRAVLRPVGAGRPAPDLDVLVAGLAEPDARRAARCLARFQDGEQADRDGGLGGLVRLVDLLGLPAPVGGSTATSRSLLSSDVNHVLARWRASAAARGLAVPLGRSADGPVVVDLAADGPHALVAGTTGSGKSELLRSWVAGLALEVDPRRLNLILVDYKGGSAFDDCARLPHTVAVITDLDEALAARALRCLEAEIRYREEVLRAAGAASVADLPAQGAGAAGLARLVVMVDEFATLAAELPGFLSSLVGVAQRGRSLGLHLVLATQRPAGVVSEAIRANTAIRVALRVHDRHDSRDVIGDERAAELPRDVPGRAVVRFGPGEVVTMQTALTSTAARPAAGGRPGPGTPAPTRVLPATGWWAPVPAPAAAARTTDEAAPTPSGGPRGAGGDTGSDLARLVAAAGAAARRLGLGPARQPWPPPLPAVVDLDVLDGHDPPPRAASSGAGTEDLVAMTLVDDPDRQARYRGGWWPHQGNLLVAGAVGSGTSTALATVAVALARRQDPTRLHLYVIDAGGGLDPLGALAHCGGVVPLGDTERRARLLAWLADELDRRRALPPAERSGCADVVLLVDGWSALQGELDGPAGLEAMAQLTRVVVDGPALGVRTVIAADRPGSVRHQLAATIAQRLILRLADPFEYRALGLPVPGDAGPGRAVEVPSGLMVQVARPGPDGLARAVAEVAGPPSAPQGRGGPWTVGRLPDEVTVADVLASHLGAGRRPPAAGGADPPAAHVASAAALDLPAAHVASAAALDPPDGWYLPLGIGSAELAPAGLRVHPGEHVLVAGPARSGRTTALRLVAEVARVVRPGLTLVGVATRRSALGRAPLDACLAPAELAGLDRLVGAGPMLVLIDDAEVLEDGGGLLARLAEGGEADVGLVAAGRTDSLRAQYGGWLRRVRMSRLGLLLQPEPDADGDLLGVRLPRHSPVPLRPGRGWLVEGGRVELVQLGRPAEPDVGGARPAE